MVDGLSQFRRENRTQTGIANCRKCFRNDSQAGAQACQRASPSVEFGKLTPLSTMTFREFVERYFIPNALPTLKLSTQKRYRQTLKTHLLPAFRNSRICDINTLQLQQFVLQKLQAGLGWACCDHFRNLMSKIFVTAKKWGYFTGDNPAFGSIYRKRKRCAKSTRSCRSRFRVCSNFPGADADHVFGRHHDRAARGRNHRAALAGCRFRRRSTSGRAKLLSRSDGFAQKKGSKRIVPLPDSVITALMRLPGHSTERAENNSSSTPARASPSAIPIC